MEDVRFRLLGPMEMEVAGEPVTLPGAAERALLVQLLLAPGRTIPATMLVDRLWSESRLPSDPMNALQIRVSKLRRALKAARVPELVTRQGVGYRAHVAPDSVDVFEFTDRVRIARAAAAQAGGADYHDEHLAGFDAALALWRGEPLSDFAAERWATAEAARLSELRRSALTERAEIALALGRHLEVIGELEPLVADEPTLEALAGLLMVALYRGGRQADALEVYTRTRETLNEQLGLEPSVSLRKLQERVLRQDATLDAPNDGTPATPRSTPAAPGPVATHPTTPGPSPSPAPRPAARRPTGHSRSPTNLPTVIRTLIGRDELLDSLTELLTEARLLTLVGPGGAGKTSLALTAAARLSSKYSDGVFGVRLAAVNSPEQVPVAVADALGMPMDGAAAERDLRERLLAYLARRKLLLVLDNCEHIIDAAATLADEILGRCAAVTVLATSREALAVPDEVQLNVGPLDTPPEGTAAAQVLGYPAAQLFVERARAVRPGTVYDTLALLAVAEITRALDGIPLALELAAARAASMAPVELAERLQHRFALLTTGSRTAEARQRTLRATVDWSYALLTPAEQRVFNRLSVFQGGWTLHAAESVVGDETMPVGAVLDTVARLVERSLVVMEPGVPSRYRMLETLRQYAAQQLSDYGETQQVAARHARYFHELVLSSEPSLRGHGQRQALTVLRQEQPNIRAALTFLRGPAGDVDRALEMAGALGLFWHLGRHLEGRELLASLLQLGGTEEARAHALQAASLVERPRACLVHPSPFCAQTAAKSLEIFERLGDVPRAALSQVLLAVEGVTGADRARSDLLLRDAEAAFVREGDEWALAVIGFVRMETALKTGDLEVAVRTGRSAAAQFRQLDDPWGLSAVLYHLGWGLRQFGRYEEGARTLEEAIDVAASAGLYNTVQWALADLAVVELNLGRRDAARELFDRASDAAEHVGDGAGVVLADYGHGLLSLEAGDVDAAERSFRSAVDGFTAVRTPVWRGWALVGLGRCTELRGERRAAGDLYDRARELGVTAGEPGLTASALEGLARLSAAAPDRARDLEEAATQLRRQMGRPQPPYEAAWEASAAAH